jgi:hypothetical protein
VVVGRLMIYLHERWAVTASTASGLAGSRSPTAGGCGASASSSVRRCSTTP